MKNAIRADFNAKPERIYRKYYSEMLLHYKGTYIEDDFTIHKQTYYSLKSSFYRLIPRPPLPTCREDISLPDAFTKTNRGGIFHIYSTADNSIMIFASLEMLRVLAECIIWHADGTFHVAPKFFQQLYLIY